MSHGCQEIASANPQERDREPCDQRSAQAKRAVGTRQGRWDDVLGVVHCRMQQRAEQQEHHTEWRVRGNPRHHDREEAGPHHGVGQQEKLDERPPGLHVGSLLARVHRPKEKSRRRRATGRIVVEKIMSKWSRTRSRLKNSFGRFSWKYGSATYWRYSASFWSSSTILSISAASSRKSKQLRKLLGVNSRWIKGLLQ